MPSYDYTAQVDVPADQLFGYLAKPGNLPAFLPALTEARPVEGDRVHVEADVDGRHVAGEAWLHVDRGARTLSWGAPGEDDYHGDLSVRDHGENDSEVTIRLHTERAGGEEVQRGLEEAVAALAHRAAAETDLSAAEHQEGWS
ncbi:SRPBCC family protein [Amycolatopsis jiangsuensis]|uniref:Putative membrane protein n=1 Tax=Amycolatopsis jiangsuensis TaxID=1181879 RepID=A0A840IPN4_9PSEU|nr:SRPBCC family protein [Amycolatopsis jiangsuensis]MBB4684471.1 putative membrane protein [Amycolatopsis jiangsuensis]